MVTVRLLKPAKGQIIEFAAELVRHDASVLVVRARWNRPALDLGYIVFEPTDVFVEYYFTDRWYTIFAISTADGMLKGWYCNVARPAVLRSGVITSEDLEIDLFVAPDRSAMLTLDMDEFVARQFARDDPATHAAALAALAELQRMAHAGAAPFIP